MTLATFLYYGRLYPLDSPLEDPVFYPFSVINAAGITWFAWSLAGFITRLWYSPTDDDADPD